MEFQYPLTLSTQLILPACFTGILLVGIIITTYLYKRTRESIYLSTALFQLFAAIFIGSEVAIIFVGGLQFNREVSVQFHRVQHLAGSTFLFIIPFLLHTISPHTYPRLTRTVLRTSAAVVALIFAAAFIHPDSFVSLTRFSDITLIIQAEYGRSQTGLLYALRDMGLFFFTLYTFFFIPHIHRDKRNYALSYWLLAGVVLSLLMALFDMVNVYYNFKVHIPPILDFSWAAIGLSLFSMSALLGVLHTFFLNLHSREISFTKVQNLANIGGLEWDRKADKLSFSDELLHSLHIHPDDKSEAVEHYLSSYIFDEDCESFRKYLEQVIDEGVTESHTFRINAANGGVHWALFAPPEILYTDTKGAPEKMLWSVQNITQQRSMESQLHHSQKMKAVGQLAGGIAHDFNNMLGGIRGAAELISSTCDKEDRELHSYIKLVTDTTNRATELTQHLLNFSRKGVIHLKPIRLETVLSDSVELLLRTINKNVVIETDFQSDASYVMGDAALLQNIFLNIGINATHAMPNGGDLTFTMEESHSEICESDNPLGDEFDESVRITISDNGEGIDEKHLKQIFEPFFTTKAPGKGTGLGLSAVYGVIQDHNGTISVYSNLGEGTSFTIDIPITTNRPKIIEEKAINLGRRSGTVLLVEDEPVVRITTSSILKKMGYTVIIAEDGQDGVEKFTKHRDEIILVILDYIMPIMDGHQCFLEMRSIDPEALIVITSGFTGNADISALKDEGLHAFVSKPYGQKELREVLA
jgi:signal transduction histidine kinase